MSDYVPEDPAEAALRRHLSGWHGWHEWPHTTPMVDLEAVHDAKHAEHDAAHAKHPALAAEPARWSRHIGDT